MRTLLSQALKHLPEGLYIQRMSNDFAVQTPHSFDHASRWLADAGLRPTRQRLALASLLVGDGKNRHVTAEGLFGAAIDNGEKVSLATVYNTLRAFCEAGLLNEITVDATRSYFDTRIDDHPHFFLEEQQKLTDAPADELEITRLPRTPEGFDVARVDVVIRLRRKG
jgi:Fur family iron response transcriptional regulator